jgi:putative transposase
VTAHPFYTALDLNETKRSGVYRELFRNEIDPGMVDQIRTATNSNYVLGNSQFQAQIAKALGRRVTPGKPGRPRKQEEPESGDLFSNDRLEKTVVCP